MTWGTAMNSLRPHPPDQRDGKHAVPVCRTAAILMALVLLAACEQNSFVPPPPPKVDVAAPVQRPVTRYLETTGNTASVKTVDLVARVQGFLQSIEYQDGSFVKEGTTLFTIEPEPFQAAVRDPDTLAGVQAVAPRALDGDVGSVDQVRYLDRHPDGAAHRGDATPTLGVWGESMRH